MTLIVKKDVPPDPLNISLLCFEAVMPHTTLPGRLVQSRLDRNKLLKYDLYVF